MSSAYDDLLKKLWAEIFHRLKKGHDGHYLFATIGSAEAVFKYENLQSLYQSLTTPDFDADAHFKIGKKDFVDRVRARKLHSFLAVLIYARGDISATRTFVQKLVAPEIWPLPGSGNDLLPAKREWLEKFFGVEDFVTAQVFFTQQASFCTVVLRKRQEVVVHDPETRCLPYLEERQLAQGSFGTVFKVKIAKGHFVDPSTEPEMSNNGPMDVARKDYRITASARADARDERDVMESILGMSRSCENILENFGSVQIGDTYSLFMPLAICDLKMYMTSQDFHPMSPSTTEAKADLIRCAEGLADGLKFLHSEMDGIVCYHMDLKPDNILIFRDRTRGNDREIWKLSDFGMARVKIRRPRGQLRGGERDFDRLFIRRKKTIEPSLSLTLNRRGEGTYLAPESISATRSMNTESDVWSLGCVISVLFAYLEGGSKGIQDYSDARACHRDAQGYDRFFVRGHFTNPQMNSAVHSTHKKLVSQANDRGGPAEGAAVKSMLDYLEKNVLEVNTLKRCEAHEVKAKLAEISERFKTMADKEAEPTAESQRGETTAPHIDELPVRGSQPASTGQRRSGFWSSAARFLLGHDAAETPHGRRGSSTRPISRQDVQAWHLSKTEDFKGCDISPDGKLVVLWTEKKIVLFNSTSFSVREGDSLEAGSEYTPETTNGFWKTMSVTEKYLIACETGSSFHCYIFDLDRGTAVDANLVRPYRLSLSLPQIHKIAISDNSRRVACILQSPEGDKSPGTLFYAEISDLIDAAKKPCSPDLFKLPSTTSSDAASSTPRTSVSAASSFWEMVPIDWPGADVTQLTFSNENHIHIVVQPELTGTSRIHILPVISLALDAMSGVPINIKPQGLDPSSTVELFTTLAPFHNALACAVVTREKRIHLLQSPNRGTPCRDIQNYRVQELMVSLEDDVMYALGTSTANHNVLLLELPIPEQSEDFEIKELAQLDGLKSGDKVTVNLSGNQGSRYVLVAALVSGSKRTVYRVRLP